MGQMYKAEARCRSVDTAEKVSSYSDLEVFFTDRNRISADITAAGK